MISRTGDGTKAVRAGDVLNIMPGVYKGKWHLTRPMWLAAPGAIVDGGMERQNNRIRFRAASGRHRRGRRCGRPDRPQLPRGMAVNADGVTVRNCRIDPTYQGGMIVGDSSGKTISGVLVGLYPQ